MASSGGGPTLWGEEERRGEDRACRTATAAFAPTAARAVCGVAGRQPRLEVVWWARRAPAGAGRPDR